MIKEKKVFAVYDTGKPASTKGYPQSKDLGCGSKYRFDTWDAALAYLENDWLTWETGLKKPGQRYYYNDIDYVEIKKESRDKA